MAERPIFVPVFEGPSLVQEIVFSFKWHPGFAASQKQKNVLELHQAARKQGYDPLLETSSRSKDNLGIRLSAFNLKLRFKGEERTIECLFQGSKVFENGGPYTDLYDATSLEAKKDQGLRNSGRLKSFKFYGKTYPTFPGSVFYDWLFLNALSDYREFLKKNLSFFDGFTDIEFNPNKSINCQARSCAIFKSLQNRGLLDKALSSFETFRDFHMGLIEPRLQRSEKELEPSQLSFLPGGAE